MPKTLIFAKDDNHAEEIVHIVREVFGEGNDFCKKITYRNTGDTPKNLIKAFRVDPMPRIAVTAWTMPPIAKPGYPLAATRLSPPERPSSKRA